MVISTAPVAAGRGQVALSVPAAEVILLNRVAAAH
jgi:hypothetical protein